MVGNIQSMAFTTDENKFVAAYEDLAVVKDIWGPYWENIQVIDFVSNPHTRCMWRFHIVVIAQDPA